MAEPKKNLGFNIGAIVLAVVIVVVVISLRSRRAGEEQKVLFPPEPSLGERQDVAEPEPTKPLTLNAPIPTPKTEEVAFSEEFQQKVEQEQQKKIESALQEQMKVPRQQFAQLLTQQRQPLEDAVVEGIMKKFRRNPKYSSVVGESEGQSKESFDDMMARLHRERDRMIEVVGEDAMKLEYYVGELEHLVEKAENIFPPGTDRATIEKEIQRRLAAIDKAITDLRAGRPVEGGTRPPREEAR